MPNASSSSRKAGNGTSLLADPEAFARHVLPMLNGVRGGEKRRQKGFVKRRNRTDGPT